MSGSRCERGGEFEVTIAACERLTSLIGNGSLPNGSSRRGLRVGLGHRLRFLGRYFRDPNTVGAIAPSSRALAEALCEPLQRATGPV